MLVSIAPFALHAHTTPESLSSSFAKQAYVDGECSLDVHGMSRALQFLYSEQGGCLAAVLNAVNALLSQLRTVAQSNKPLTRVPEDLNVFIIV